MLASVACRTDPVRGEIYSITLGLTFLNNLLKLHFSFRNPQNDIDCFYSVLLIGGINLNPLKKVKKKNSVEKKLFQNLKQFVETILSGTSIKSCAKWNKFHKIESFFKGKKKKNFIFTKREEQYRRPSFFAGVMSQEFPENTKTANNKGPLFFTFLTFLCHFCH